MRSGGVRHVVNGCVIVPPCCAIAGVLRQQREGLPEDNERVKEVGGLSFLRAAVSVATVVLLPGPTGCGRRRCCQDACEQGRVLLLNDRPLARDAGAKRGPVSSSASSATAIGTPFLSTSLNITRHYSFGAQYRSGPSSKHLFGRILTVSHSRPAAYSTSSSPVIQNADNLAAQSRNTRRIVGGRGDDSSRQWLGALAELVRVCVSRRPWLAQSANEYFGLDQPGRAPAGNS